MQPLDGDTMGSMTAVATWAAHHSLTRSHLMATQWAARRRWQRGQHTTARHAGGSTVVAATWVAHCGLTRTRWRHDGQRGGGGDAGNTPRPDTQGAAWRRRHGQHTTAQHAAARWRHDGQHCTAARGVTQGAAAHGGVAGDTVSSNAL